MRASPVFTACGANVISNCLDVAVIDSRQTLLYGAARQLCFHAEGQPLRTVAFSGPVTAVRYPVCVAGRQLHHLVTRGSASLRGAAPCHALDFRLGVAVAAASDHLEVFDESLAARAFTKLPCIAECAAVGTEAIALGCVDRRVHVYSLEGEPLRTLRGHDGWVRSVSFSPSGKFLASASQDGYTRVWTEDYQLHSLLVGHRGWVQSVRWLGDDSRLVTASMDKTLILWAADGVDESRVGEIGGNSLGFYAVAANADATCLYAVAYNGSIHAWRLTDGRWNAVAAPMGHAGPVEDVCWDPKGRYFLSCSQDQTVRLWAVDAWCELARPLIHGHDMRCVESLPGAEHSFITCAEEKVIRVFDAPSTFCESLKVVCGFDSTGDAPRALGATLPPLGLSNKPLLSAEDVGALEKARNESAFGEEIPTVNPQVLHSAPTENVLQQSTLWPERLKLYGHGNELFCVCASPDGRFVASAAKGRKKPETDVIVWDTRAWEIVCRLSGHKMTATRVQFSPDSQMLCSAGRDKSMRLWRRVGDTFVLVHAEADAHKRIIWDCCWSPDGSSLATASRDHSVKFWSIVPPDSVSCVSVLKMREPVTAVCYVGPHHIAVGLDSGAISVWDVQNLASPLVELSPHAGTVKRLRWHAPLLVSAGDDHSVRVSQLL